MLRFESLMLGSRRLSHVAPVAGAVKANPCENLRRQSPKLSSAKSGRTLNVNPNPECEDGQAPLTEPRTGDDKAPPLLDHLTGYICAQCLSECCEG